MLHSLSAREQGGKTLCIGHFPFSMSTLVWQEFKTPVHTFQHPRSLSHNQTHALDRGIHFRRLIGQRKAIDSMLLNLQCTATVHSQILICSNYSIMVKTVVLSTEGHRSYVSQGAVHSLG